MLERKKQTHLKFKEAVQKLRLLANDAGFSKLRTALRAIAAFAVGMAAAVTGVFGGLYPLGIAAVCTARGSVAFMCTLAGALAGSAAILPVNKALTYVLALVGAGTARLVFSILFAPQNNRAWKRILFFEDGFFRVLISCAAAIAVGSVGIISGTSVYYDVFSAILLTALSALFCAGFSCALDPGADSRLRPAGFCLMLFAVTSFLSSLPIPLDIGVVFAFLATLYLARSTGAAFAAAAGLLCGLGAVEPAAAPMFAAAAICIGFLADKAPGTACVAGGAAACAWCIGTTGFASVGQSVPEVVLATALGVPLMSLNIIPKSPSGLLMPEKDSRSIGFQCAGKTEERYRAIFSSMESISKMLVSVSDSLKCPTREEAYRICTAARAKYCGGCPERDACESRYSEILTELYKDMTDSLVRRGRVSAAVIPESIAASCPTMDSVIDSVNTSAARLGGMSRASETARLFADDYCAIASMLREGSDREREKWENDSDGESRLSRALYAYGFDCRSVSVYGKRRRSVYMRVLNTTHCSLGEDDIRRCAQEALGSRLSAPDFSIEKWGVSMHMSSAPMLCAQWGKFCAAASEGEDSGDTVCTFENDDGYRYCLISDGMGSGRSAALTSGISTVFLKNLLCAGSPMRGALEMLNCFVRGNDGECFTTVDIMEADMYTGHLRFIKSGAAPSFVLRDGRMFRIHSKTVPVGIMRALDAEAVSLDVRSGDTVVMISDGVTGSYEECPWLYSLLSDPDAGNEPPAFLARRIGEAAVANNRPADDVSVCVVRFSDAQK